MEEKERRVPLPRKKGEKGQLLNQDAVWLNYSPSHQPAVPPSVCNHGFLLGSQAARGCLYLLRGFHY